MTFTDMCAKGGKVMIHHNMAGRRVGAAVTAAVLSMALVTGTVSADTLSTQTAAEQSAESEDAALVTSPSAESGAEKAEESSSDTAAAEEETAAAEENSTAETESAVSEASADSTAAAESQEDSTLVKAAETQDMYRLYNPNSGEHFYTADANERDHLKSVGWKYESVAWRAPKTSETPVYRLYNPNAGDHHYTTNRSECDMLTKAGWKLEGIAFYSDDAKGVAIYRLYNPNCTGAGAHHYTASANERDNLVKVGWKYEGVCWYGAVSDNVTPTPTGEATPTPTGSVTVTPTPSATPIPTVKGTTVYNGVDYSAVYDFNYYVNHYADIRNAYLNNPNGAIQHFVDYGMKEQRRAIATFDEKSYRYEYRDLRAAYRRDFKKYYLHYMQYGKKEGRVATGVTTMQNAVTTFGNRDFSAIYDYQYYVDHNPDVLAAFGDDDYAAIEHFACHGLKEGRIAKASYDQNTYNSLRTAVSKYNFPKADAVLNQIGWDLRAAFNWSVGMTYYGHTADMPSTPNNGYQWFADYGFTHHKGNCYCMAGTFYEMAELINQRYNLGYTFRQVYGHVNNRNGTKAPHSWVEVTYNGATYVCDPNMVNEWPGTNGYMNTYGGSNMWSITREGYMN